ncbi:MAG: glycyl-radical enzyme activating protein [Verrucomicrobiae bacterium]|nr:glycyl-radical enzyme activating protein [Verrucomicrobiae bacterium]
MKPHRRWPSLSPRMIRGLITNVQRYSVHDGPGIRTTVFLKGCPLNCAWCHNPETISPRPELMVITGRCVRCGQCADACPNHAPVGMGDSPAALVEARADCLVCGACVEVCPADGRRMVGREFTVPELLTKVSRDRVFFEESGGGVTFSGGEPLSQFEFLLAGATACRKGGLHVAVDTSGFALRERFEALVPHVDLFLYDLKSLDDGVHRRFCGVSNRLILENLRWLSANHGNLWLRFPVIPGVNDDPRELAALATFAAGLDGVKQVHLLPYHAVGAGKRERLGASAAGLAFQTPSTAALGAARAVFRKAGLETRIGG